MIQHMSFEFVTGDDAVKKYAEFQQQKKEKDQFLEEEKNKERHSRFERIAVGDFISYKKPNGELVVNEIVSKKIEDTLELEVRPNENSPLTYTTTVFIDDVVDSFPPTAIQ